MAANDFGPEPLGLRPVSYTQLTLPTNYKVYISVGAVA
jgi:hypothetical protein